MNNNKQQFRETFENVSSLESDDSLNNNDNEYYFHNNNFDLFELFEFDDETNQIDFIESHPNDETDYQAKKRSRKLTYKEQGIFDYKYRRRASQFPRIVKRDFRRHFPLMYLNILNHNHMNIHTQFVDEFFDPNSLLKVYYRDSQQNKHRLVENRGRDYLNKHCLLAMIKYSDIVYQFQNIEIHRSLISSNHCQIKLTMHVVASKMPTKYGIELESILSLTKYLQTNAMFVAKGMYDFSEELNHQTTLIFYLDENHRVYEIHAG